MKCVLLLKWIKFSVKKIKHEKNTGKLEKILEKSGKSQGILSVRKSGNPGQISTLLIKRNKTAALKHYQGSHRSGKSVKSGKILKTFSSQGKQGVFSQNQGKNFQIRELFSKPFSNLLI